MKISRLREKYVKNNSEENRKRYAKQRNITSFYSEKLKRLIKT